MKLRYLLDENLSQRVALTIRRHYFELDVLRVGDEGAPAFGTLDPEILIWLEENQRTLVTDNRKSMPGHLVDHYAAGRHHWGLFLVSKNAPLRVLADALYMYWDASEAEQWADLVEWLPV